MSLLHLFVTVASFSTVLSCACKKLHPQESFCHADYVIRVKVIGSVKTDRSGDTLHFPDMEHYEKIYYPIRITKVYKGNLSNLIDLKTHRRPHGKVQYIGKLYVPPRISSCSVSFSNKRIYVIMGQIHQGSLHHELCEWRAKWRDVTKVQRHGFKKQYAKGCQCTIRMCPTRRWCSRSRLPTECRWVTDYGYDVRKCVDKYQVCKYNSVSRTCKWRRPEHRRFKKCIRKTKSL